MRASQRYTELVLQLLTHPTDLNLPPEVSFKNIRSVDQVGVEERATTLTKRSIKRESKVFALKLAITLCDLTTLEGQDTRGKITALCTKAIRPEPSNQNIPSDASVCVYPSLIPYARTRLTGTTVRVCSVATGFPSGQTPTKLKVEEAKWAVSQGADEIDMVINREAFLSGDYTRVYNEIRRVREACEDIKLKVILETGELATYDNVRCASLIAIEAGADFIKTSTGKINPAATLPVTLVMLESARDVFESTGRRVGIKAAGGIRHAKQAIQYLVLVNETLGSEWLSPTLFRLGASSLLNDILMQIRKEKTGHYQSKSYFTID